MNIKNSASESLDQLRSAISLLKPEWYCQPLETLHQNSIGRHVRHVLEFFQCLSRANTWHIVNYDDRQRNQKLENDLNFAMDELSKIQFEIGTFEEKTLTLFVDYGYGEQRTNTTLFRELVYNIEHTVHHLALIKIGINQHFPSINLSENLGVAYSTQQFLKAS